MTVDEIKLRFPHASYAFIRANATGCEVGASGLPATKPKPNSRLALDSSLPGKEVGGWLPPTRAFVSFHIYSIQPRDWDNTFTKPLQDMLIEVGILAHDSWKGLQGIVIPHKVKTKKEERTEIEIWYEPMLNAPKSEAGTSGADS